eukprot:3865700-Amphidinium_carterae.1
MPEAQTQSKLTNDTGIPLHDETCQAKDVIAESINCVALPLPSGGGALATNGEPRFQRLFGAEGVHKFEEARGQPKLAACVYITHPPCKLRWAERLQVDPRNMKGLHACGEWRFTWTSSSLYVRFLNDVPRMNHRAAICVQLGPKWPFLLQPEAPCL